MLPRPRLALVFPRMGNKRRGNSRDARPHIGLSLVELTRIVDDPGSSTELISEIADELRLRTTRGAAQLLARIPSGAAGSPIPPGGRSTRVGQTRRNPRRATPDEPSALPTETPTQARHFRDMAEQLEVLRTTFTAESEILARWGITEALPDQLRNLVFEEWSRIVSDDMDVLGRTRTRLIKDMVDLEQLTTPREEIGDHD